MYEEQLDLNELGPNVSLSDSCGNTLSQTVPLSSAEQTLQSSGAADSDAVPPNDPFLGSSGVKTLASTINPSSYKLSGSDVADLVSISLSADQGLYSSSSANHDAAPPNDSSLGSSGVKTLALNINPSAGKFLGSDNHTLFSG